MTSPIRLNSLVPSSHFHPEWSYASRNDPNTNTLCEHCHQDTSQVVFNDGDIHDTQCFCGYHTFRSSDIETDRHTLMENVKRVYVEDENGHAMIVFFYHFRQIEMKYLIFQAAYRQAMTITKWLPLDADTSHSDNIDINRAYALKQWLSKDVAIQNRCPTEYDNDDMKGYIEQLIETGNFSQNVVNNPFKLPLI